MSSSHYVYFGIFLVCTKHKTYEIKTNPHCSSDSTHRICGSGTNFCPECGSAVICDVEDELLGWYDLIDSDLELTSEENRSSLEGKFYNVGFEGLGPDTDILIPSYKGIFSINIGEDEGFTEVDLTSSGIIFPDLAVDYMRKEINLMKEILYSNIEVKFGYVSQWG